ncbi:MAG: YggS family pyridoxal phosphate-dependent enzyme [Anaerolineales bacterium]|nr:YggS family pyridoxal phosphate-dependent enzyme [Anaerolineales bacterium]MCZ2122313.1 YggS family pyridoxal phosphate-dependent enzyme [Anaerolineales bacterium]
MSELVKSIREKYEATLDAIAEAARRSGRPANQVKLVVVTKTQTLETVQAAIAAGAKILGENYPEEGAMKIQSLENFSAVEWHMLGHVQSRKAQIVAQRFDFMHSLDSLKLANRLNRFCGEAGRTLPVLLEFNLGGEESKSGWLAVDEANWRELASEVQQISALANLQIRGLMTMPPLGAQAEDSRPYFQKLRRLQEFLKTQFPQLNFDELSMGTSADFEVAVEEGATLVRVGSAIVGPRQYK